MKNNISTYSELLQAKKSLKSEISKNELEIKSNKFLKLTSAIGSGDSIKKTVLETVTSVNLKELISSPIGNMASTFLLTNKSVRKYFIAFTILKETIPYAFDKLKSTLNEIDLKKDN